MNAYRFPRLLVLCFMMLPSTLFSQWELVNTPEPNSSFTRLEKHDGYLYASANNLYYSSDEGNTWKDIRVPFTSLYYMATRSISFTMRKGVLFVATLESLLRSTDHGATWEDYSPGGFNYQQLFADEDTLYLSTWTDMYRSTDLGLTWSIATNINNGLSLMGITHGRCIYRTADADSIGTAQVGSPVQLTAFPDGGAKIIAGFVTFDTLLIGATTCIYSMPVSGGAPVFYCPAPPVAGYELASFNGSVVGIQNQTGDLFIWERNNSRWVRLAFGLPLGSPSSRDYRLMHIDEQYVIISRNGYGFYRASLDGSSGKWVTEGINDSSPQMLGASSKGFLAYHKSLYLSTDLGGTWNAWALPVGGSLSALTAKGDRCAALTWSGECFVSSDGGVSWAEGTFPPGVSAGAWVTSFFYDDAGRLYAAGKNISEDNGATWQTMTQPEQPARWMKSIDGRLYGAFANSLYRSTDQGQIWEKLITFSDGYPVFDAVEFGQYIVISHERYLIVSSDDGTTWEGIAPQPPACYHMSFFVAGNTLIAYNRKGMHSTTDFSVWHPIAENLGCFLDKSMEQFQDYLIIGTDGYGVYRRNLNEITAGIIPGSIPASVTLSPVYPNPFSGTTAITFTLPERDAITLEAYDMLGRNVQTIRSGILPSGDHTAQFNAAALPAGAYRIVLRSGEGAQSVLAVKK